MNKNTIVDFETERRKPIGATPEKLRRTFEAEGVQFTNGTGINVKKNGTDKKPEAEND